MENNISLNINRLIESKNFTPTSIGRKIGKSRQVVNTYIKGTNPPIPVIQRICKEFNFSIDTFVNGNILEEIDVKSKSDSKIVKEGELENIIKNDENVNKLMLMEEMSPYFERLETALARVILDVGEIKENTKKKPKTKGN